MHFHFTVSVLFFSCFTFCFVHLFLFYFLVGNCCLQHLVSLLMRLSAAAAIVPSLIHGQHGCYVTTRQISVPSFWSQSELTAEMQLSFCSNISQCAGDLFKFELWVIWREREEFLLLLFSVTIYALLRF